MQSRALVIPFLILGAFGCASNPMGSGEPWADADGGAAPPSTEEPPPPPTPPTPPPADDPPDDPPAPLDVSAACAGELCWSAGSLPGACGRWTIQEDFSSGRYGVHAWDVHLQAGVRTAISARAMSGVWAPVLLVLDAGSTIHDGEVGVSGGALVVEGIVSGRDGADPSLTLVADEDRTVKVLLTSWANRDGGFEMRLPDDVTYAITVHAECEDETLLSPPNLDDRDTEGGFFLLPQNDGLYSRRADACSRGTRLLIDVIYTAALRWSRARPDLPRLDVWDLNEGPCSTVNHATHDDGTHVDLHVECGTEVSCRDDSAAVTLAKILVDTGQVCGILFNDESVQPEVNAYFASRFSYTPWRSRFMRTVTGHTHHFHVRVRKPDGTCN